MSVNAKGATTMRARLGAKISAKIDNDNYLPFFRKLQKQGYGAALEAQADYVDRTATKNKCHAFAAACRSHYFEVACRMIERAKTAANRAKIEAREAKNRAVRVAKAVLSPKQRAANIARLRAMGVKYFADHEISDPRKTYDELYPLMN